MVDNDDAIVFTSMDELFKYNVALLNGFVSYLNSKHKINRDVFHCGANVQIVNGDNHVNDFSARVIEKIQNDMKDNEEQ